MHRKYVVILETGETRLHFYSLAFVYAMSLEEGWEQIQMPEMFVLDSAKEQE